MIKDGNSLGINVLSGFVRVDKGAEAERSGLVGPRPLSVSSEKSFAEALQRRRYQSNCLNSS